MEQSTKVVLFVFAGRKANIELQLEWVDRVLTENNNVDYHIWDLSRRPSDHSYLSKISGGGITVFDQFYGYGSDRYNDVWRWYASRSEYQDTIFIKVDDDVVYFDHTKFSDLVDAASAFKGQIVSALTINNGASTPLIEELYGEFHDLNVNLLDVHMSNKFAEMAHSWFFDNYQTLLSREVRPVRIQDWLSINCIGMTWSALCCVAQMIGTNTPSHIAGRDWPSRAVLGDEGACNIMPRIILDGVTAGHLMFGPQQVTGDQADAWRDNYNRLLSLTGVRNDTKQD